MSVVVAPTEEECYLIAILDGADGLDLAEFSWYDPESSDGCYRAWDFQWEWYTCEDMYQVDQGARALGKTVGITMRAFAFPFNFPGQKMLLTAPELNHLRPLTDAIEQRLLSTRLSRELLPQGRSNGMNRQPHWQCTFNNQTMLVSRLPNKDGKGVKGQHVLQIELDEAQDYPLAGWIEIVETLNRGLPGAAWRCHGVPKGTRDKFYDISEGQKTKYKSANVGGLDAGLDDVDWTVHRPMAMNRPTWSVGERNEKIGIYGGSRQSIDYKRNIYGEHGDAQHAVFVLARLMDCIDTDPGSVYNNDVYTCLRMDFERMPDVSEMEEEDSTFTRQMWLRGELNKIPGTHKGGYSQREGQREVGSPKGYSAYWGGADIGVTNHPSEFLIFGQRSGSELIELVLRCNLNRINTDDQKFVIEWLFDFYGDKLKGFGMDKTGVGFPIWDQLSRRTSIAKRIFGFNFSEKRVVAFEDREPEDKETMEDLAIMRNVVEATTDWLRNDYVDLAKIRMPYDKELMLEFQGQTYTIIKDSGTPYGQRVRYGGGSFHTLDAAKMVMGAMKIPPLEAILNNMKPQESILDMFMGAPGMVLGGGGGGVVMGTPGMPVIL